MPEDLGGPHLQGNLIAHWHSNLKQGRKRVGTMRTLLRYPGGLVCRSEGRQPQPTIRIKARDNVITIQNYTWRMHNP
jgi:hypothetical protein